MIYIHLHLVCCAAEVGLLFLKGLDDRQQLFIIDGVVELGSCEFLRKEYNRIELSLVVLLSKLPSDHIIQHVSLNLERLP